MEIWKLVAPTTGTHNVVVNFSANLQNYAVVGVITFIGVSQTTPLGSFAGNNATSNAASVTITSSSNDLVLGVLSCETCTSVSFTTPATQRWNLSAGGGDEIGAGATKAGTSPNTTIAATLGRSDHWAMGGVAVKPVGGSGNTQPGSKQFVSFQSPGEELQSSGPAKDIARVVKSRPRQVKGLRVQLSLVRETGMVWRSYYFAGGARIAMREDSDTGSEVIYLFADHLGSTSVSYRASDGNVDRQWYKPWGELRPGPGSSLPTDYQFTGQRNPGWGLYYFKARWFDSQLGRFTQADTLIADPFSQFDYDRYHYVHNNSMRFTDPTGNRCESAIECAKPRPSQLDRKKLGDQPRGRTGINGLDFYEWYKNLYANKTGWWWEVFGMDDDGFTIWDAIAVVFIGEAQGYWNSPYLAEAAIRVIYYLCEGVCTIEDQINIFAAYSQTAGTRVKNNTADYDPRGGWVLGFDPGAELALNRMSASFANQPDDWKNGCVPNRPCGWGNNSPDMYTEEIRQKLQVNQNALFAYNPSGATLNDTPWFIPSGCVVVNWLAPSGKSPRNLSYPCSSVR